MKSFKQKKRNCQKFNNNVNTDTIEGRNAVLEALKSDRTINKILISKGKKEGSIVQIISIAKEKGIVIQEVDRKKLDNLSQTLSHQGVIAFVSEYDYVEVEEIIENAKRKGEPPFVVILDEITDPHNLGSIIRSANAAGVHGIVIPKRRSVGITAVVAKSSAGAVEYVPVARVSNISQTIEQLKNMGIWIVGADVDAEKLYYDCDFKGAVALVIGSEGKGIKRLVKDNCDFLVKIPMRGEISSLNAGVAAAVLMYEVVRQRISLES